MDKYKINYIYDNNDINDIFVKVLNKELKKYILMIGKVEKCGMSSCTHLSQKECKNFCDEFK